jgi:hypothetical protein
MKLVEQQDEVIRLRKLKLMRVQEVAHNEEDEDQDFQNLNGLVGRGYSSMKKGGVEAVAEVDEEQEDEEPKIHKS